MKNDPLAISGIKRMVGDWAGYHRVRVGDIRVIFWIDKEKNLVSVDQSVRAGTCTKGEPNESTGTVRPRELDFTVS